MRGPAMVIGVSLLLFGAACGSQPEFAPEPQHAPGPAPVSIAPPAAAPACGASNAGNRDDGGACSVPPTLTGPGSTEEPAITVPPSIPALQQAIRARHAK